MLAGALSECLTDFSINPSKTRFSDVSPDQVLYQNLKNPTVKNTVVFLIWG
jgi:hypothetical protein